MTRLSRRICLLLVAVLAASLGGSCRGGKQVTEERTIGYKGEARANPFLAAQRTLRELGHEVEEVSSFGEVQRYGGVLVANAAAMKHRGTALRALEWVRQRQGNLIVLFRGSEIGHDDFTPSLRGLGGKIREMGEDFEHHGLLVECGAKPSSNTEKEHRIRIEGVRHSFENETTFAFDVSGVSQSKFQPRHLAGEKTSTPLVTMEHGSGTITLVADAKPFRNRYLGERDHAALLAALISVDDYPYSDEVFFLIGSGENFFLLVWQAFPFAVISVAALILFWLWKYLPRFGPLRRGDGEGTLQFAEHLRVAGQFLWRHRCHADLLLVIRRAIQAKVARRYPLWLAGGDEHLVPRLAETAHLPEQRVAEIWNCAYFKDPTEMTRAVRDFQKINEAL